MDFPRSRANLKIWVIEPSEAGAARSWSIPVADLPTSLAAVKDQWVSSNLLQFQDGDTLFLAGGYGQNTTGELVTYSVLSSVKLPDLVRGVMLGKDTFSGTIAWGESPLVQATGGELLKLDDGSFYLVGGHVFMGAYRAFEAQNEKNTPKVYEKYLREIRKLRVQKMGEQKLAVSLVEAFRDPEFARRDLNVTPTVMPDGSLGGAAYGGVFTKDQLKFTRPIYFGAHSAPAVDSAFEQKMSAYSCAKLLMFDSSDTRMYTTLFGGISRWTWNYGKHQLEQAVLAGDKSKESGYYDGMPWIDHISTLVRGRDGTVEIVQPENRLAGFVGANAAFLPLPGLERAKPGSDILSFRQFRGKRVLAGYLYGGVHAFPKQFPYTDEAPSYSSGNVPTKPSDMILKVYVTAPAAQ